MKARRRLDQELVRRQLVSGRTVAREVIGAGRVTVDGAPATKASRLVSPGEAVVVAGPPQRYVSRGGRKLEAALAGFGLDPDGMRAIDVGSSTGGFTDCLLQHGAASVVALDVGRGQLHQRLRGDPRVAVHERTNVRGVDGTSIGAPFDLLVSDLSFISLRLRGRAMSTSNILPMVAAGASVAGLITSNGLSCDKATHSPLIYA